MFSITYITVYWFLQEPNNFEELGEEYICVREDNLQWNDIAGDNVAVEGCFVEIRMRLFFVKSVTNVLQRKLHAIATRACTATYATMASPKPATTETIGKI